MFTDWRIAHVLWYKLFVIHTQNIILMLLLQVVHQHSSSSSLLLPPPWTHLLTCNLSHNSTSFHCVCAFLPLKEFHGGLFNLSSSWSLSVVIWELLLWVSLHGNHSTHMYFCPRQIHIPSTSDKVLSTTIPPIWSITGHRWCWHNHQLLLAWEARCSATST